MARKADRQTVKTMKRPAAAKGALSVAELTLLLDQYTELKADHELQVKEIEQQLQEKAEQKSKLVKARRNWMCKLRYYQNKVAKLEASLVTGGFMVI